MSRMEWPGGQRLATRPFHSEGLTRLRLPFSGSHEASIPAQERPAVMHAVVNRFDARAFPVPPRRLPEDLRAILVIPKGRFQVLEGRRGGDFSSGTHERLERMEEGLREQFGVGVSLARFDGVVLEFPHIKREALELFVSEA